MTTKKSSSAKPSTATKGPTPAQQAKTTAESVKTAVENTGLAAPSAGDVQKARTEGVKDAIKEDAKDAYHYATDGQLPGEPPVRQHIGYDDIMLWEPNLRRGIDDFEAAIAEDAPSPIPEEKVYGLLALERNGQNRTPYVQAMMKRLDLKANELPGGGPPYTNDVTNVTELK